MALWLCQTRCCKICHYLTNKNHGNFVVTRCTTTMANCCRNVKPYSYSNLMSSLATCFSSDLYAGIKGLTFCLMHLPTNVLPNNALSSLLPVNFMATQNP